MFLFSYLTCTRDLVRWAKTAPAKLADSQLPKKHSSSIARIVGRQIESNPASEQSIFQVREWIHECTTVHAKCSKLLDKPLPTRVIDVGPANSSSEPSLLLSEGLLGQYVALSHVWGGLVPVRTLKKNLSNHLMQLPLSCLPASFRDAVIITRRLGFRYLWIDALCIIQDSEEDWEIECARMGDIYRNSTITIAAVDAVNSRAGFLNERSSLISSPPSCKFPRIDLGDGFGIDIKAVQRDPVEYLDKLSPLTFRAWCIQEKLLSPRMLYYGSRQTYWDCNTLTHLEAYGCAPPANELYGGLDFGKAGYSQDFNRMRLLPKEKRGSDRIWMRFVHEYSSRSLTVLDDKLPALSGLAQEIHNVTGFHYLAGLWKEDLSQCLLWSVEDPDANKYQTQTVPYTAPSWSWASYHAPVQYRGPPNRFELQILEAETSLAGPDPFGKISSGYLCVRGRIKQALVRYQETSTLPDITYRSHCQSLFCPMTNQEIGRASFDYSVSLVPPAPSSSPLNSTTTHSSHVQSKVLCLALERSAMQFEVFRSTVMLIQPVECKEEDGRKYQRVGMAYVQNRGQNGQMGQDWFVDSVEQTIVII